MPQFAQDARTLLERFKVASIAAAMVTLNRPQLMFQYVGTGEHAGQVIGFDVSTEHYEA